MMFNFLTIVIDQTRAAWVSAWRHSQVAANSESPSHVTRWHEDRGNNS